MELVKYFYCRCSYPISTSSLPDFFFFKVFFLDEGLLANCASFTCLAFRLESRFPIKNKELMSS